jgi:hypothetical protein
MHRWLLIFVVVCAAAGKVYGEIVHDFVAVDNSAVLPGDDSQVPDFNDGSYFTFGLVVTLIGDDDWTATGVEATITGPATFFQHPSGGDGPPDAGLIAQYPAVEFDSYFSGAPDLPFFHAVDPINDPTFISATWYDMAWSAFDQYAIARFTVHWLGGQAATIAVDGSSSIASTSGFRPFNFVVTIPEPGTLTLLALGALAFFRRTR